MSGCVTESWARGAGAERERERERARARDKETERERDKETERERERESERERGRERERPRLNTFAGKPSDMHSRDGWMAVAGAGGAGAERPWDDEVRCGGAMFVKR